jgi:carboxylesterase type B
VGSSSEAIYDGASIAAQGVVVVSINYRLGALGFMWCEGGDANCGLWDAVRALEWTQENILQFNGDPSNVTIGGESAGAGATACLVASPVANKLFHRAIAMSAVAHSTDDEATAKMKTGQFASSLGLSSADLNAFQEPAADLILRTQGGLADQAPEQDFVIAMSTPGWSGPKLEHLRLSHEPASDSGIHYIQKGRGGPVRVHGFSPCVDGELLPAHPLDLISQGSASLIDLMVGSNREENGFRADKSDPEISAALTYGAKVETWEDVEKRAAWFFMGYGPLKSNGGGEGVAKRLVESYRVSEAAGSGAAEEGTPQHVWNRLASDMSFNASTVMLVSRQSKHNPGNTYAYRFDGFNRRNAFHGWELGLFFGTLYNTSDEHARSLADSMRQHLTNYMKSGDPNADTLSPQWPTWGQGESSETAMYFDRAGNEVDQYRNRASSISTVIDLIDTVFFHESKT